MIAGPRIIQFTEKKMVGQQQTMSFAQNTTGELWRSFMPRRKEITNIIGTDLYSVQLYATGFFRHFNPQNHFEKWAAVEVTGFNTIPAGMKELILPAGLYAVFHYIGSAMDAAPVFQSILRNWLPQSDYTLDDRPHFEILGKQYRNNHPDSEEEIWIPVVLKA